MNQTYKHREGEIIGNKWKLIIPLGSGGNAEVWEARDANGQQVAIKILLKPGRDNERFLRFQNEVEILRRLGNHRGILPLVDSHVPLHPSTDLTWLAIPEATKARDQVGPKPAELQPVVEAIAAFALALAQLQKNHGITHRDIKPENLYYWNDQWVLGDFGLVKFPEAAKLTATGKHVGSFNYLAPELRTSHFENVDYGSSDVYALAKTFWVLASGYPEPPFGHHRTDRPLYTISKYFPSNTRAHMLDVLIQVATDDDPLRRPTMAEFANELTTWLQPAPTPTEPRDISDLARAFKDLTAHKDPKEVRLRRIEELARRVNDQLRNALAPLHRRASQNIDLNPHVPAVSLSNQLFTEPNLRSVPYEQLPDGPSEMGAHITITSPSPNEVTMWSGFAYQLLDEDHIYVVAAHLVYSRQLPTPYPETTWAACALVRSSSIQEEFILTQLANGLEDNLRDALSKYLEILTTLWVKGQGIDPSQ